jgi:hypothetical protein
MKKIFLLLTLISTFVFNTKASHNLGGEITYLYWGGNNYKVTVKLYTDCSGLAMPSSIIINTSSASCALNQNSSLPLFSTRDISQVCDTNQLACNGGTIPGLTETVYEGIISNITPCTDWVFSYGVCCRNGNALNINNPTIYNFYIESTLNNLLAGRNSPIFIDQPRWMIPVNQTSFISAGTTINTGTATGDSIFYSLVAPLSNNGSPVAFNSGYSATEPFISIPGTSINNQTGIITTNPTSVGQRLITVKVDEFKNGLLISSVSRDFTVNIINGMNTLPAITNSTLSFNGCTFDTLTVDLYSFDPTDTVTTKVISTGVSFPNSWPSNEHSNFINDTNEFVSTGYGGIHYINVQDNQCPIYGVQSYAIVTSGFDCDSVWPGDANSDLIANVYDLLPIGVFYNTTGSVRPSATTNWVAQYSSDWGANQSSGADIKHIDCDGDAIIDINDVNPILLNYNLTHVARWAENSPEGVNDPTLYVDMAPDTIPNNTPLSVPIMLGTTTQQADSVYGIAMSITYDPFLIDSIAGITVDYSNSWLGTEGVDMITLDTNFYSNGQIDIGLVRTDGQMMSGFGEILTLNVITIDNLSGKTAIYKTLTFDFLNVVIIDNAEDLRAYNQELDSVIIEKITTSVNTIEKENKIHISPNPNNGNFKIYMKDLNNSRIEILNTIGQTVSFTSNKQNGYLEVNINTFQKGIYFIKVYNENKITAVEKIVVH